MSIRQAEALASCILNALDEALCIKLRDLTPQLEELRSHFKELKKYGGRIVGCKTWDEFCRKRLHRTRRAVNMLLCGAKEQQIERERTSHLQVVQADEVSADQQEENPGSAAELETGQEEACHSAVKADKRKRTIEDVVADARNAATNRVLAHFRPMRIDAEKLREEFIHWVEEVASDLGLHVRVEVSYLPFGMPAADRRLDDQEMTR